MYDMLSGVRAGKLLATCSYQERPQSLRIGERTSSRLNTQ
jgi:hypothetical protein